MRKFLPIILGTVLFLFSSCSGDDDALSALTNLLNSLELDDCYETEEEGYVPEETTETEDQSEEKILEECKQDLIESYDVSGDGKIDTDAEIEAVNADIQERQSAKKEMWSDEGLTEEQGKAKFKLRRKIMREIAKEECKDDYDSDANGELSAEELKKCHDDRKTLRQEVRRDLRCSEDTEGECGPVPKDRIKVIFKVRVEARNSFVKEFAPNETLTDSEKQAARSGFKTKRDERKGERKDRLTDNKSKEEKGRKTRKDRGTLRKPQ